LLKSEDGIVVPALLWTPQNPKPNRTLLYLHEEGKATDASPGGAIDRLVQDGATVLAVDLPGSGQTQSKSESKDVFTAYLLGRSYVGLQAEHVVICARYARELSNDGDGVELVSVGQVGIPALHAAALEPDLFQSAKLVRTLKFWSSVIPNPRTQVSNAQVVYGALTTYDLPDLVSVLGAKLTVEQRWRAHAEHPTNSNCGLVPGAPQARPHVACGVDTAFPRGLCPHGTSTAGHGGDVAGRYKFPVR